MDVQAEAFKVAHEHGFWDGDRDNVYAKLALVHSEVSEALEVARTGRDLQEVWFRPQDGKPEGFGPELADVIIRVADLAHRHGIDLGAAVAQKMNFNRTRPYMHGKTA